MAIRLQGKGSRVYHLQTLGHPYWETMCGRRWHTHGYMDDDGVHHPRVDKMREVSRYELFEKEVPLCKNCESVLLQAYWLEIFRMREEAREGL